jgi:hypothetical protein
MRMHDLFFPCKIPRSHTSGRVTQLALEVKKIIYVVKKKTENRCRKKTYISAGRPVLKLVLFLQGFPAVQGCTQSCNMHMHGDIRE